MVIRNQPPYSDELDHCPLVNEFRSVSDARGVLFRGLVQTARQLGALVIFLERGCRGGHLRIRVVYDECQDGGAIPIIGPLGACANLVAHGVVRGFRATLSPCRTTLAGVEHLQSANARTDSQFHFSRQH